MKHRTFFDPFSLVKSLAGVFTGKSTPKTQQPQLKVPSAAADAVDEATVRAEASRKSRAAAAARGGKRTTLLTAPTPAAGIESVRRTLFGSS